MSTSRRPEESPTVFSEKVVKKLKEKEGAIAMTWKQVGAIAAGLAALATVHTLVILPYFVSAARDAVRADVKEMIKSHAATSHHPGAVSRNEFRLLQEQIRDLKETVTGRLDRIEAKIQ